MRTPMNCTSVTLAIMIKCGRETLLHGCAAMGQSGQVLEPGVPIFCPSPQYG